MTTVQSEHGPNPREREVRQACGELDRRVRSGESWTAEQIFTAAPHLAADPDTALEIIYAEFVARESMGDQRPAEHWFDRFPQWRPALQRLFEVHQLAAEQETAAAAATQHSSAEIDANANTQRQVAAYEILEAIGQGGMGVVYKARQCALDRLVALKLLRYGALATREEHSRFHNETEAAARLQHPNIVQVFEVGEHDGLPFLSMEYIDGGNLEERLADNSLPATVAARLVATLAQTIDYAHAQGIVHRDLKPANVLLARSERAEAIQLGQEGGVWLRYEPKISDFGLAKRFEAGDINGPANQADHVTQTGMLLGTPGYMSPEQAAGKAHQCGQATDIYALGAILYRVITGRPPFQGESAVDTLEQIRHNDPPRPSQLRPKLPRDLETICLKCLEKQPAQRYSSAQALAQDLSRFLSGEPILARPAAWWERSVRWARRRPAIAALCAAVFLITAIGFAGVSWQWKRAHDLWQQSEFQRGVATTALGKARAAQEAERAERRRVEGLMYFHDISLACAEYLVNNTDWANQILNNCSTEQRHWEWQYLKRICNQEVRKLQGLSMPVWSLAYSADGKRIAAGSGWWGLERAGEIKVWDAFTGESLFTFHGQLDTIMSVAFSRDGKLLASASMGWTKSRHGDVRLWNLETGEPWHVIEEVQDAFCVAFHPHADQLAIGCNNGEVRLFDLSTRQLLPPLGKHPLTAHTVAYSADGKWLASGSRDGTIHIWNMDDFGSPRVMNATTTDVRDIEFSPCGEYLASATFAGTINIWKVATAERLATHEQHGPFDMAYSPDGQHLALATRNEGVRLLHAMTGRFDRSLPGNSNGVLRVAYHPNGRQLASGGNDRMVKIWDVTRDTEQLAIRVPSGAHIADFAFSPSRAQIAVATTENLAARSRGRDDKLLRIMDAATGKTIHTCPGHSDWLTCIAYSSDGALVASGSRDRSVRIWDAASGELRHVLNAHADTVSDIDFSHDNRQLISVSHDQSVRVWDVSTGALLRTLPMEGSVWTQFAVGGTSGLLAMGAEDGSVRLFNLQSNSVTELSPHAAAVTSMSFSRNGRFLASGAADGLIYIWDVRAEQQQLLRTEPLHTLRFYSEPVTGLDFSPDGKRLISAAFGWSARLWDTQTGHEVLSFPLPLTRNDQRVAFNYDGQQVAFSAGPKLTILDAGRVALPPEVEARNNCNYWIAWHEQQATNVALTGKSGWAATAFHWQRVVELCGNDEPPELRWSKAKALFRLANVHRTLAEWPQALERVEHANVILETALREADNDTAARKLLAKCCFEAGLASDKLGRLDDAAAYYNRSFQHWVRVCDDSPQNPDFCLRAAQSQLHHAIILKRQGDLTSAESSYRDALNRQYRAWTSASSNLERRAPLSDADALQFAVACAEKLRGRPPNHDRRGAHFLLEFSLSIECLGDLFLDRKEHARAEEYFRVTRDLRQVAAGQVQDTPSYFELLARSCDYLARAATAQGQHARALEYAEEACAISQDIVGRYPAEPELARQLAGLRNELAWMLIICPEPTYRDPMQAAELAAAATEFAPHKGAYWNTFGAALALTGRNEEAILALERSMQLRNGGDSFDWFFLALAHHQLQQTEQAESWLQRAVDGMPSTKDADQSLPHLHQEILQRMQASKK